MRRLVTAIALSAITSTYAWASSGDDVRRAYDAARRCMVANSYAAIQFKRTGDAANAQLFTQRGETAFKQAYYFGDMLRLSQAQVTRDLDATSETEMARLAKEPGYLTEVARFCKQWGLM